MIVRQQRAILRNYPGAGFPLLQTGWTESSVRSQWVISESGEGKNPNLALTFTQPVNFQRPGCVENSAAAHKTSGTLLIGFVRGLTNGTVS
jgi:hypothetical protein